jgi:hypothetical protein
MLAVAALLLALVQSPNDTAAIKAAAADSGEVVGVRVVLDTAWVRVVDRHRPIDIPSDGKSTAGTALQARDIRLERRRGRWTVVARP